MKSIIVFFYLVVILYGAPAREVTREFIQSSGETFIAKQKGDEYLHWVETPQEDVLIYNKQTENYDYGVIESDTLKASGIAYKQNKRAVKSVHDFKIDVLELWRKKRGERL